jgi:DNA-binding transcriptional LysR family regulator
VLPRAACEPTLAARRLRAMTLDEPWAQRQLLLATREPTTLTPAAALFVQHLKEPRQ